MKKLKLFTHNDLDGVSPVILLKLAAEKNNMEIEYQCLDIQRVDKEIMSYLNEQKDLAIDIYITDISVNDNVAEALDERTKMGQKIVLIDHHATALHLDEKYSWAHVIPKDKQGVKTSATTLFYKHLVEEDQYLIEHPLLNDYSELVRLYDTWDWTLTHNMRAKSLNDILYLISIDTFIEQTYTKLKNPISSIPNEQQHFPFSQEEELLLGVEQNRIQAYIHKKNKQMKKVEMHLPFLGTYQVGLLFAESYQSELGNELCNLNEHIDFVAMIDAGKEKISFRSSKTYVDVSQIAGIYGGGGHPSASGCSFSDKAIYDFVMKTLEYQMS